MKRIGSDCPLLFNKWQPIEFNDFNLDESGEKFHQSDRHSVNLNYVFPFAFMDINFDYINDARQEISANQIIPQEKYKDLSFIFNKDILELYVDTKQFLQKHIDIASKLTKELEGLVVDNYSKFQRSVRFAYTVDADFKDVDLRNRMAIDVYLSLKDHLKGLFLENEEFFHPGQIMGIQFGTDEAVFLKNGINLNASGRPDKMNAGTIYLSLYCDETGSQTEFQKVFDETTNFLRSVHKDKLVNPDLNFGLKGQGSYWNITLPEIRYSKKFPNSKSELLQLPVNF